jgi:hypothetical protein
MIHSDVYTSTRYIKFKLTFIAVIIGLMLLVLFNNLAS